MSQCSEASSQLKCGDKQVTQSAVTLLHGNNDVQAKPLNSVFVQISGVKVIV